jgi:multicomponent Na+:H+ antiporter subunit B
MTEKSSIIATMTGLLYPFVVLFGFYIIANGHNSPGGGFQGGSVIASLFIARYLVLPADDFDMDTLHLVEKAFLVVLLLLPLVFIFPGLHLVHAQFNVPYLIAMNFLIGMKVSLGLTIIVFRFGFFREG